MQISHLSIERVRNLSTVVISDLQPFNVFYGENGSGKTSILESLHILATGRSFRTHLPKVYIQHQAKDAVIFAQSTQDKMGVQKYATGEQLIRVNGDNVATQGQLAKLLPVHHLDPQSADVLDYGAKPRRQLLDWLMFHVEHQFYPAWQQYGRALKQRNRLLKSSTVTLAQLEPWNHVLVEYGELIHQQRVHVVDEWQRYFYAELQQLLPDIQVQLGYYAGFHTELGLAHDLIAQYERDVQRGTTEYGVHRADLRLKSALGDVDKVFSRGQKKMLMMALKLSQIAMLHSKNRQTIVLLDDLSAELDAMAQQRLLQRLAELGSQVFITVLDKSVMTPFLQQLKIDYAMFQVQQGQVLACEIQH